ncbi:phospholipase A2 inhibitor and Ly6/PLAUR domain-containing protein-like [Scomber scombrus]|uniref:phospholipase A2 inhibitor and Ly6/PLAUR domain-containing protein-like n=1 Tax=Scomber scombrus TaxID=13677 RepID=UPI002DDBAEFE|nr:phospholipase A2 inhibitor and Ly6/PLAUR domain-containing protein-like [Scomber scombrus]
MMKLILSLTLIWTLSSTAEALECWQISGDVTELHPCESTELCATFQVSMNGHEIPYTRRWCAPSSQFSEGKHTFSASVGFANISAYVCNTDGCNNQTIRYPGVQKKNKLQCFTCDDPSSDVCNQTVQCVGEEDRCINGTVEYHEHETARTFGCVSANICETFPHLELLPELKAKFLHPPTCCEGSFCNSAWSVKLNVMTLLFGLITLIFY